MTGSKEASVYYSALRLSNVKAFAGAVLDLRVNGGPAPWTLVLGENGLGKTTLLQCLALMRPILNVEQSSKTDARDPDRVEPALPAYEDSLLVELARVGDGLQVSLEAEFSIGRQLRPNGRQLGRGKFVKTGAAYKTRKKDLSEFGFTNVRRREFVPPLVVAYSAARHPPYLRGKVELDPEDPISSLFDPEIELIDAVEALENLDYKRQLKDERASSLYDDIKSALARILPEVEDASRIHVYGPAVPGQSEAPTGVWLETYSGEVPLHSLSVGYQTMFAWTVDLAWRMAEHHKDSVNPLREAAIVLIDELDLHLHPKWQRRVRRDLSDVFPNVQFIVTTHSPVLAQTYLDTNIAVVFRDGDHAVIDNDPRVVRGWRVDQVSESLLHDLDPYSPEIVGAFQTRKSLLAKEKLTKAEKAELQHANTLVATVQTSDDQEDREAAELIRKAAQLIATRAQ